jgi:LysM repeat protein
VGTNLLIPVGIPYVPPQFRDTAHAIEKVPQKRNFDKNNLYRVRRGDTIYKISKSFNITPTAIAYSNNLRNPSRIYPGQKLVIPAKGSTKSTSSVKVGSSARKVIHLVKKGETLYKIANRYKTSVSKLMNWNGLRRGGLIFPGDQITVFLK